LRTTQFSILAKLKSLGPLTISALAKEMVMDRTTLGRNYSAARARWTHPRRPNRGSKELHLTSAGEKRPARWIDELGARTGAVRKQFWCEAR
jgi:hypothetical protein